MTRRLQPGKNRNSTLELANFSIMHKCFKPLFFYDVTQDRTFYYNETFIQRNYASKYTSTTSLIMYNTCSLSLTKYIIHVHVTLAVYIIHVNVIATLVKNIMHVQLCNCNLSQKHNACNCNLSQIHKTCNCNLRQIHKTCNCKPQPDT